MRRITIPLTWVAIGSLKLIGEDLDPGVLIARRPRVFWGILVLSGILLPVGAISTTKTEDVGGYFPLVLVNVVGSIFVRPWKAGGAVSLMQWTSICLLANQLGEMNGEFVSLLLTLFPSQIGPPPGPDRGPGGSIAQPHMATCAAHGHLLTSNTPAMPMILVPVRVYMCSP